ncbi:DNA repair protein Rev1 [Anopheles nili]|uniref:DNA repair protein Rev1 n=1 Tax=Anopheles nili TaxID=185578 RepID=UPI00237C351A|nr:DNA repair protein Rev1 [Anopheles nili]
MKRKESETGFELWGDYMSAKIAKLEDQFQHTAASAGEKVSNLFAGISIFVNGYTNPSAEELKRIMMLHGGVFHHYKRSHTTYTIASILPDVKVRSITSEIIISPRWVVDCLKQGKLLDYSRYLLYSQQKPSQPKLCFTKLPPLDATGTLSESRAINIGQSLPKESKNPNDISRAECLNVLGMLKDFSELPQNEPLKLQSTAERDEKKENDIPKADSEQAEFILNDIQPASNANGNEEITLHLSPDVFSEDDAHEPSAACKPAEHNTITSPPKPSSSKQSLTATDPNFLTEFFNNSRLHHIATLGASFKQHVAEMREKSTGSFPAREALVHQLSNRGEVRRASDSEFSNAANARYIMHIDMDCFFVSVGLRKYPHLRGLPVAVTHSRGSEARVPSHPGQNRTLEIELYHKRLEERYQAPDIPIESRLSAIDEHNSLSEIASCSYEARRCGVKNGMFVGAALKLCPELKTIPYDFDGYREVAHHLYNTIAQYTLDIEAVSCDEMFVDLTELIRSTEVDVMHFVTFVRDKISTATGCACSAGVGANRLQARMATKKAKPNGQFQLNPCNAEEYMRAIAIGDLPGVGPSTSYRLKKMTYVTCADLQTIPKNVLQTEFGKKFGETLYNACRGIDERPLVYDKGRKSVSVDVNYGIRFTTEQEVDRFMRQLTQEIHRRLVELRKRGKLVTVKLLVRSPEAPVETAKFMGHGLCDIVTKSLPLRQHTDELPVLECAVLELMRLMAIQPRELRGIGIQISKFDGSKRAAGDSAAGNRLRNMFQKAQNEKKHPSESPGGQSRTVENVSEKTRSSFQQPDDQQPCTSRSCTVRPNHIQVTSDAVKKLFVTPTKAETNSTTMDSTHLTPKRPDAPTRSPSSKRPGMAISNTRGRRGRPPNRTVQPGRKEQTLKRFLATTEVRSTSSHDVPAGLDPDVLAALPEDIRQEVIRDYRSQQFLLQSRSSEQTHPPVERTPVKSSPQRSYTKRDRRSPATPQGKNSVEDQKIKIDFKFLQVLPPHIRIEVEKQIELNKDNMVVVCDEPEIDEPLVVSPEPASEHYRTPAKILASDVEKTPRKNDPPQETNILRRSNWRELVEEWVDSTEEPYEYDVQLLAANGQELCCNDTLERLYIFLRCFQRLVVDKRSCAWHRAFVGVVHPIQEQTQIIYGRKLAVRPIDCELCNIKQYQNENPSPNLL